MSPSFEPVRRLAPPPAPAAEESETIIRERMRAAGVPLRHLDSTLDAWTTPYPGMADVLETARGWLEDVRTGSERVLIMHGDRGTGKTRLAAAILRQVGKGASVAFRTASGIAREIRSTYHRDAAESEEAVLRRLTRARILVVDEIGVGTGSEHERNALHEVLAARYDARRPTILVSNLSRADLLEALGDRIVDRLKESGAVLVAFVWPSFRGK